MIRVNPSDRQTFDTLLHNSRGAVFPELFYCFLYNYVASLNELSSEIQSTSAFHSQTGTPLSMPASMLAQEEAQTDMKIESTMCL